MQEHQHNTHFESDTAEVNPPLTTPNPPLHLLPIPLRMQLLHTVRLTFYPPSTPNTLPPSVAKHRTRTSPTATPIRTSADEQPPHGRPRGSDVDDAIPEAHEGENDAGGVGEGERDEVRVDKRVNPID